MIPRPMISAYDSGSFLCLFLQHVAPIARAVRHGSLWLAINAVLSAPESMQLARLLQILLSVLY